MKTSNKILVFFSAFVGVGAVFGAGMMLYDPSGKQIGLHQILPFIQELPLANRLFQDYIFTAFALLICNGLTNAITLILFLKKHRYGSQASSICGGILMLWTGTQFCILPANPMSTAFLIIGMLQVVIGIFSYRENMKHP